MKLRQVLAQKKSAGHVLTVGPEVTLQRVIDLLCEERVGALIVSEQETKNMLGIVSERDVLRSLCSQRKKSPEETTVAEVMTRDVIVAKPDEDAHTALSVMSRHDIQHLPVTENDRVVEMLSTRDLLRALYQADEVKIHHLEDYLGGTYGLQVY